MTNIERIICQNDKNNAVSKAICGMLLSERSSLCMKCKWNEGNGFGCNGWMMKIPFVASPPDECVSGLVDWMFEEEISK